MRSRAHRTTGNRRLWAESIGMAARLVTAPDWHWFVRHIPPLLNQAWLLGDGSLHLRLTALLMRTATPEQKAEPWLITHRSRALIRHRRHAEAARLLATLEPLTLRERTRSIVQLLQVHCQRALGDDEAALAICDGLRTYTTDTALAEAHYQRGALLDILGRSDAALENDRTGGAVSGGGRHSDLCTLRLCRRLLNAGNYEECRTEARQLREAYRYPASAEAANLEASAMALSGYSDDDIRQVLQIADWAVGVLETLRLATAFTKADKFELLVSSWTESAAEQREWLLGGDASVPRRFGLDIRTYIDSLTSDDEDSMRGLEEVLSDDPSRSIAMPSCGTLVASWRSATPCGTTTGSIKRCPASAPPSPSSTGPH